MPDEKQGCGGCTSEGCPSKAKKTGETDEAFLDRQALEARLCRIRHKVLVLSGKGGVGKSTVAVNLAVALRMAGKAVGLLDSDFHGPSVPRLLGLKGTAPAQGATGLLPAEAEGIKVFSVEFLLPHRDDAVIWRGPMKMGALRQFLRDVEWGDLDVLVIDLPPGTGDEPLSLVQAVPDADGAVIVATPQEVSLAAVRKSVTFCRRLKLPVLGVVENMSGFACPRCGEVTDLFGSGGAEAMARETGVSFLGRVPLDRAMVTAGDEGRPFVRHGGDSPAARALRDIAQKVLEKLGDDSSPSGTKRQPSVR